MATADEVRKLGELARISVSDDELPKFVADIDAILGYISTLEKLDVSQLGVSQLETLKSVPHLPYTNVFREDGEAHASGMYTEKIAKQFPAREGDLLSVKQIISHD